MLKPGLTYKHLNNTDVALEIQGVAGAYPDGTSYIGRWWNIVHAPHSIKGNQVVFIKKEQLDNWVEFDLGKDDRLRDKKLIKEGCQSGLLCRS